MTRTEYENLKIGDCVQFPDGETYEVTSEINPLNGLIGLSELEWIFDDCGCSQDYTLGKENNHICYDDLRKAKKI